MCNLGQPVPKTFSAPGVHAGLQAAHDSIGFPIAVARPHSHRRSVYVTGHETYYCDTGCDSY